MSVKNQIRSKILHFISHKPGSIMVFTSNSSLGKVYIHKEDYFLDIFFKIYVRTLCTNYRLAKVKDLVEPTSI